MARSGPHSLYTPAEREWLDPVIEEFVRLISKNLKDAARSRAYKASKVEEFLKKFESQLVDSERKNPVTDIGKWRKVCVCN